MVLGAALATHSAPAAPPAREAVPPAEVPARDQFTPAEPVPPMGLQPAGLQTTARFWAPAARQVYLVMQDRSVVLERKPGGVWDSTLDLPLGSMQGQSYAFQVTDEQGRKSLRSDPYARRLQGQLRGVGELYLHPRTGQEVHKFYKAALGPSEAPTGPEENQPQAAPARFARLEVQQQPDAESVCLRLFGLDGKPLDRKALEKRLGDGGQELVRKFGGEGLFWKENCAADGRIALKREGQDAWDTVLNRPEALQGLTYRFEVRRNGKLVGDTDGNGELSADEAAATAFNDPYGARLDRLNDQRWSVVHTPKTVWKNPRPKIDPTRAITYQAHVGSFMGQAGNARRSTFKDLIDKMDYFQELGVNQLELLPTNSFEGMRDWGYIGTSSLSVAEQYGFVDEDGRWVSGFEALQRLTDEAHGRGIAVLNDVVFNHWGGDFNNLWEVDGKRNSYFNWGDGQKNTPWGPMPAYNQPQVRELIKHAAMVQFDELGFDGLRFDFTHPMHDQKDGGGDAGWSLLQEITSEVHRRYPNAFLAAEEFPNHPIVATPVDQGGAGFDSMWNTEFQHRLVHDGWNPSIIQQAVAGQRTDIDKFMNHLTNHPGFANDMQCVTVISNHDEVGNADRTITVASGGHAAGPWERGLARMSFGVGMLSPGRPIFFQGEESLADNSFRWGIPSTWDTGWEWRQQPESPRARHFDFCQEAIALRKSLPGLAGNVPARSLYVHNDDSVFAFSRGEDLVVVGSLGRQARPGYKLPLPPGRWELVLNSDDTRFGGSGVGTRTVQGGPESRLDVPAGAMLLYRRVG